MLFYMPQRKITPPKLYIDGILIDYYKKGIEDYNP